MKIRCIANTGTFDLLMEKDSQAGTPRYYATSGNGNMLKRMFPGEAVFEKRGRACVEIGGDGDVRAAALGRAMMRILN